MKMIKGRAARVVMLARSICGNRFPTKHNLEHLSNNPITQTTSHVCLSTDVNFMSNSSELSNPRLDHILRAFIDRRKLWLIPGCAALLLSWFYVYFIRSESYPARQTLIVRDDLLGQSLKPGQFESLDLMKSAQETILEIARKPQVVRKAMKKVGPARVGWFGTSDSWPDDKTIETVQGSIKLSAPNGAEFGHTVLALLDEMNVKINEVRDLRLRSMTNELTLIRDSAQASLAKSAEELSAMEREIGADLPTLRSLSDPQSGEGAMSQTLLQIRLERRQFENRLHSAESQRKTLVAATRDPNAILATSDELFSFQPALSRLKQELIEAQSALAESVGRYEQIHPEVQKHREQVRSMHLQIHQELDSAKRGLRGQIASLRQKVDKSLAQEQKIESRFNRISSKRVDYLRLDEEVKKKTEVFNEAQSSLASTQQLGSEEFKVSLLTPVDEPQVSTKADGLGAKATILGSGLAGMLAGFGLILLLDPGPEANRAREEEARAKRAPLPPGTSAVTAPVAHTPVVPPPPVQSPPATAPPGTTAAKAPPAQPSVPVSVTNATTQVPPTPINTPAPISPANVNANAPQAATGFNANPARVGKPVSVVKPEQASTPATQPAAATKPTPSAAPAKVAAVNTPDRAAEIQAEIDKAVAQSTGTPSGPQVEVKPTADAPVKRVVVAPPALAQPAPGKDIAEMEQVVKAARPQADSTGVPTAASILAAMEKISPDASPSANSITQPQSRPGQTGTSIPSGSVLPRAAHPADPVQGSNEQELEIQRRAGQPSAELARPESQTVPLVALEPNASSSPDPAGSTNPFLNPTKSSSDGPAATAQRMLDEAKTEAESKGMVAPTAPATPAAETTDGGRLPATTVPIPDQIKQLTDSIASFAKPIERVQNPTDF